MGKLVAGIVSYLVKNAALLIGVVEAVLKVLAGITSLTPTKKDDKIYAIVNDIFSKIKKWLYDKMDFLSGTPA